MFGSYKRGYMLLVAILVGFIAAASHVSSAQQFAIDGTQLIGDQIPRALVLLRRSPAGQPIPILIRLEPARIELSDSSEGVERAASNSSRCRSIVTPRKRRANGITTQRSKNACELSPDRGG